MLKYQVYTMLFLLAIKFYFLECKKMEG